MLQEPGVVGSNPTGATANSQRRSSAVEHRNTLIQKPRRSVFIRIPTAQLDYISLIRVGGFDSRRRRLVRSASRRAARGFWLDLRRDVLFAGVRAMHQLRTQCLVGK